MANNMSYCRFENTLCDFEDCKDTLEALFDGSLEYPISERERKKAAQLVERAGDLVELFSDLIGLESSDVNEEDAHGAICDANEVLEEVLEETESLKFGERRRANQ